MLASISRYKMIKMLDKYQELKTGIETRQENNIFEIYFPEKYQ